MEQPHRHEPAPGREPKPAFLGRQNASAFQDESVVRAYHHRPPYPAAVFDALLGLLEGKPRAVLDIGCGTGAIARPLAPLVERVDAVDISSLMVEKGRTLPGGDHPALHWIVGAMEDAPLRGPYGLATAGASLHWMEWDMVLPRLAQLLVPGGRLAIIAALPVVRWRDGLDEIIRRYSTTQDFQPLDLPTEIERRDLFRMEGRIQTEPEPFVQPLDAYIESFHGRSSFSRERMGVESAAAFDAAVRELVRGHCTAEPVRLSVVGDVTWGQPLPLPA